ncbi:hypothetical protein FOZ62_028354, partial [Perkinsus olseni]
VDLHSSIAAAVSNYVPTSFLEEIVLRFHDGSRTTADILSRQRERLAKLKDCVFVFDEDESSRGDLREDLQGGWQGKYNAYLRRVGSPLEPAPSSAQAQDDLDNVILPSGVIRTLEEMRSMNVKPTVFAWMPLGVSSVDADALAWTKGSLQPHDRPIFIGLVADWNLMASTRPPFIYVWNAPDAQE